MNALSVRVLIATVAVAMVTKGFAQREAISNISKVYNETEEKLGEMRHLSFKEFSLEGEFTNTLNAWFDETGELRKVSDDGISSHGDLLEEFFFDEGKVVFFFSLRKHTPFVEKAQTTVNEERIYLYDGQIIRHLTKEGVFAEGKKHDMSKIKNVGKTSRENRFKARNAKALEIAQRLEAMADPEATPAGPAHSSFPHGKDYRLIEGSVSPSGRYAVGWAPNGRDIDWKQYTEDGKSYMGDYDKCSNFLVDLTRRERVAKLPSKHFGDKQFYNHNSCTFDWSPDSTQLVHTIHLKWHTESCALVHVGESGLLRAPVDVLANASEAFMSLLKKQGHPTFKKHGKDLLVGIQKSDIHVGGGGSLTVNAMNVGAAKAGEENASVRASIQLGKTGEVTDIVILTDEE